MNALFPNMAGPSGDARPALRATTAMGAHGFPEILLGKVLSNLAPASAGALLGFSLTLPLPPSANNLFKNLKQGRAKTDDYRFWRDAAGWSIKAENPKPVAGRYALVIMLPTGMRGDISNRIKAIEDLLVLHKLTVDDSKSDMVLAIRSASVAGQCCIVRAFPISSSDSVALAGVGGGPRPLPDFPQSEGAEAA